MTKLTVESLDLGDIVILHTPKGKIEFVYYGALYQVFNRRQIASGCYDTLQAAQKELRRGWTMDVVADCRERRYFWSHACFLIKEFSYREAMALDRSTFALHANARERAQRSPQSANAGKSQATIDRREEHQQQRTKTGGVE